MYIWLYNCYTYEYDKLVMLIHIAFMFIHLWQIKQNFKPTDNYIKKVLKLEKGQ